MCACQQKVIKAQKRLDSCANRTYNSRRNTNNSTHKKGGGIMAKQEKGYTPEQIKDAEKLCQLMQKVPDAKRQMFSVSVLAYMNGFEAGIALGRDMVQAQTTG